VIPYVFRAGFEVSAEPTKHWPVNTHPAIANIIMTDVSVDNEYHLFPKGPIAMYGYAMRIRHMIAWKVSNAFNCIGMIHYADIMWWYLSHDMTE
jgi:hypothetical protein